MIKLEAVEKRFGSKVALDGVGFEVQAGEVVALAGHNGAGKTTTIHLLLGLLRPDGGRLRVLGKDPLERRHLGEVGWMPERPAFPPRHRVASLVRFQAATFPGWDGDWAEEWLERLELDRSARAGDLSRGGAARLGLLFALAHRPRVLLLDDPTLGLDPAGRRLVLGEVLAMASESGAAVLVATHLLAEAERALDRLVVIHQGRVTLDEEVASLRQRHRRLRLPAGREDAIPSELAPKRVPGGLVTTRWDEAAWARLRSGVAGATAAPLDLEDIYVAVAGEPSERPDQAGHGEVAA